MYSLSGTGNDYSITKNGNNFVLSTSKEDFSISEAFTEIEGITQNDLAAWSCNELSGVVKQESDANVKYIKYIIPNVIRFSRTRKNEWICH